MEKKVYIQAALAPETHRLVKKWAGAEGITVSNLVAKLVTEWAMERENSRPEAAKELRVFRGFDAPEAAEKGRQDVTTPRRLRRRRA